MLSCCWARRSQDLPNTEHPALGSAATQDGSCPANGKHWARLVATWPSGDLCCLWRRQRGGPGGRQRLPLDFHDFGGALGQTAGSPAKTWLQRILRDQNCSCRAVQGIWMSLRGQSMKSLQKIPLEVTTSLWPVAFCVEVCVEVCCCFFGYATPCLAAEWYVFG